MRLRPGAAILLALALAAVAAVGLARHWLLAKAPAGSVPPAEATLDLNRASERELSALPGLGPNLAQRIVRHKNRCGRFSRPEDLLRVKGIGPRKLARWRPWLRLEGPAPRQRAEGDTLHTVR